MAGQPKAPGLARKVQRTLNLQISSDELHEALSALSDVTLENSAATRRQLRPCAERKLVEVNADFLAQVKRLVQVCQIISHLRASQICRILEKLKQRVPSNILF